MMNTIEECLNKVTETYTQKSYLQELKKARDEFFGFIGAVHEEDSFFEAYMNAFIEWYILERELLEHDLTPVRLFYKEHFKKFLESDQKLYNDLTKFRHSLYLVKKVSDQSLVLEDLHQNEKIKIESDFPTIVFSPNDVFEAILVPFQGQWKFLKTFFQHPTEVKSFIVKEMKAHQKADLKILLKLIFKFRRLRLKFDRYPYVSPTQIYTSEELSRA